MVNYSHHTDTGSLDLLVVWDSHFVPFDPSFPSSLPLATILLFSASRYSTLSDITELDHGVQGFVFLYLIYFTQHNVLQVYPCRQK